MSTYIVLEKSVYEISLAERKSISTIEAGSIEAAKEKAAKLYPGGCDITDGVNIHTVNPKIPDSTIMPNQVI